MSVKEVELEQLLEKTLKDRFQQSLEVNGAAEVILEAKRWLARFTVTATAPTLFNETHVHDAVGRLCSFQTRATVTTPVSQTEVRLCWLFLGILQKSMSQEQLANMESEIVRIAIDLHYSICRPPMFDIFAHLSANEMFFIDGDSLVTEAFCKPNVDWDLMQPLHVNFYVQRILQELLARGGRFHVIFFDSSRWMWKQAPQKLFIREVVKDSLLNLSTKSHAKFVVKNFPSWYSEEYKEHFESFDPEFVIMTDGEQMCDQSLLQMGYTLSSSAVYRSVVEDESVGRDAATYYHGFMIDTVSSHAQVVYSSRLVFKDNAVVAFVVRSSSDRFAQFLVLQDAAVGLAKSIVQSNEFLLPSISLGAAKLTELKSGDLFLCFRERVAAAAVLAYLDAKDRTDEEVALCKAFLITAFAASAVPAAARAQPVSDAPELKQFLDDIASMLTGALQVVGVAGGKGQEFDPIDGHLLFAFIRILKSQAATSVLSEEFTATIDDVWQTFVEEKDSAVKAPISALPTLAAPQKIDCKMVPPLKHELVTSLAAAFKVTLHDGAEPYPTAIGSAKNLAGWVVREPFDEHNDVINVGKVEDEKEDARNDQRKQDKKLRQEARLVTVTQENAESLGAALFLGHGETLAVVADKKDDETDQQSKGKEKANHSGQSKKYIRTNADKIREENNLRLIRQNHSRHIKTLQELLNRSERFNDSTRQSDRDNALFSLQLNLDKYRIDEVLIHESEVSPPPGFSKAEVWRALVALTKKTERDVALDSNLECFEHAKQLVEEDYKRFLVNQKPDAPANAPKDLLRCAFLERNSDKERVECKTVAARFVQQIVLFFIEHHYLAALEMRVMRITFQEWQQEREEARLGSRKPDLKKAVKLFLRAQRVITRIQISGIRLPSDDVTLVRSVVRHLEFPEAYNTLVDQLLAQYQAQPTGSLPENVKPRFKLLDHTVARFQLCEMGELLERPVPPFRDSRVSFKPDWWQRELLDIVDNRGSAVVCAPTSAGKTFISFYCMKNALMTTNDRIVVYVAPTRALINQALADVCARFGMKKYANPGLHVYGALGGDDYHHNHDSCQVLITLPEVFETMLLSPKYTEWAKRIDYVIFDEIHSMESSGNGPVWERVLALTTAPFIALSATLGETEQLCGWLNRIQDRLKANQVDGNRRRDYSVSVIPRQGERIQRWNDIEKYVYQPPQGCSIEFESTERPFEFEHIKHLHPLSTVTLTMLRGKFPPDLSLVPKECVALYDVMKKYYSPFIESYGDVDAFASMMTAMKQLAPETYFAQDRHIVQNRAREYEAAIKQELLKWAQLGVSNLNYTLNPLSEEEKVDFRLDMTEVVSKILGSFQEHLKEGEETLKQYSLAMKDVEKAPFPDSIAFVKKNIVNVLQELKQRDRRPTIVFSFESEDCEELVEHVVSTLEAAEAEYRATSEFEQYRRAMEQRKEDAETRRRLRQSQANSSRAKGRDDEEGRAKEEERYTEDAHGEDDENYEIPDVLPQFAFFGRGEYNHVQFTKIMEDCKDRGADLFARALKRGICIHHAGVSGKLRGHAERMFRSLYCSVIFATETLALGVHSPCRSVVLAGDHILLNTTQFRQMMGRAGRRGLDHLGHLIFMGVSLKKVNRLMTSDLMVIKGHVQVDSVTQLRMLQLHDYEKQREKEVKDYSKWKESIQRIAVRLVANPLYFIGRERMNGNMEPFQVRLMQALLRFFYSEGLHFAETEGVSAIGALISTVTHVFRNAGSSNSGFLFAHMLTSGILREAKYINNIVDDCQESALESAAEALSYAFTVNTMFNIPLEVHRSALRNPEVQQLWNFPNRKFPRAHRVVLTPLRGLNLSRVDSRRKTIMQLLSSFYVQEAATLCANHDGRLPFMTLRTNKAKDGFERFNIFFEDDTEEEAVVALLMDTSCTYKARHPIAALSGCGDAFGSLEELSLTLRDDGLYADSGMFPFVDFTDSSRHEGCQILVNACVPDFMRVGAQTERGEYRRTLLQNLNGLSQGDSYHTLDRVELIMSNLIMRKPKETSHIYETLNALKPEDDSLPSAVGALMTLKVGEKLCSLRRQIDNQAYLDRQDDERKRFIEERDAQRKMAQRGQKY